MSSEDFKVRSLLGSLTSECYLLQLRHSLGESGKMGARKISHYRNVHEVHAF